MSDARFNIMKYSGKLFFNCDILCTVHLHAEFPCFENIDNDSFSSMRGAKFQSFDKVFFERNEMKDPLFLRLDSTVFLFALPFLMALSTRSFRRASYLLGSRTSFRRFLWLTSASSNEVVSSCDLKSMFCFAKNNMMSMNFVASLI